VVVIIIMKTFMEKICIVVCFLQLSEQFYKSKTRSSTTAEIARDADIGTHSLSL